MSNTLKITACDNQLLVLAYQSGVSFELANISSGQNLPVDVTIEIDGGHFSRTINLNGVNNSLGGTYSTSLATGEYSLALIGIDWGGPTAFTVELNGQAVQATIGCGPGVTWAPEPISFQVS